MSKPRLSGIAPPPSLDDILSADLDHNRVGAVDFTSLLAPEEDADDEVSEETAASTEPAEPAKPTKQTRQVSQARADALSRARQRAVAAREQAAAQAEPAPEAVQPDPAPVAVEPEPEPTPVAVEPEPEPTPEAAEPEPEPEPEPDAVQTEIEVPNMSVTHTVEPTIMVVPELEPDDEFEYVGYSVERVAESVVTRMQAAGDAHLRHLEAIEVEAARRCELLTAQAELDAELIRLHARREAHAIIAAARLRTGGETGETAASRQLHEIGETFSRFAETLEATVAQTPGASDYPLSP